MAETHIPLGLSRMDSGDDARNTFPRDSRPTLNRRASFTGRFMSAPSVANTPNEPMLTRTTERRREATVHLIPHVRRVNPFRRLIPLINVLRDR